MSNEWYLGVIYGPNSIRMGLAKRCGEMEDVQQVEIKNRTPQNTVSTLILEIENYLRNKNLPAAIGIGLPGYVNPEKGIWMHCMSMSIRQPVPLVSNLEQVFSIPICIDNDLNVAALAENFYGIGRISRNFLFVQADEGVALGIIADGRLLRGVANCAGEIGHLIVETDGALCECNSHGCLEPIIALDRISEEATKFLSDYPQSILHKEAEPTPAKIFEAAQNGDELACQIAHRAVKALGIGLVDCVNLLNPEHIIVTGRVGGNPWFLEHVKQYVYDNGFVSSVATLKDISTSFLQKGFTEVLGAASLCYAKESD